MRLSLHHSAERIRTLWQQTHSPQLELCRHFCGQFFESEFVSKPGQLKLLFGGVLSLFASLSILVLQAYYHKYLLLKRLDDTQPFRLAVMADVLFLIALTIVFVGLVTTLQWQSLFPDRRDYLALAALPLRMQEIFRAKFLALSGFVTMATLFLTAPASVGLPWMMQPQKHTLHEAVFGDMGAQILGMFFSCFAAGLFVFFTLVALQGVLLNLLPLRASARLSLVMQAGLLMTFLAALPLALDTPRLTYSMNLRPDWAVWVPPLWFLGLHQVIVGNSDPLASRLAWCSFVGLISAAMAAIAAYWWSYRRHRIRVLEAPGTVMRTEGLVRLSVARWLSSSKLIANPRTLGVFMFIAKTLGGSPQHRLILTGFIGIAVAFSANSVVGLLLGRSSTRAASIGLVPYLTIAAAGHLALSLFTLCGLRYLFRLPVEPRANWIFRISEPGNTVSLLAGVECFMLYGGVVPVALLNLLVDSVLFGVRRGTILTVLAIPPALLLLEVLLFPCDKIPFTSLYLPARRLITETLIKYGVGVVLYISILSALLSWCADSALRWVPAVALMLAAYVRLRSARLDTQRVSRLEFEELPEVVVQTLGIYRD